MEEARGPAGRWAPMGGYPSQAQPRGWWQVRLRLIHELS